MVLNCACGRDADVDSEERYSERAGIIFETVIINGRVCIECQRFTCGDCIALREALDDDFDPAQCGPCNDTPLAPFPSLLEMSR